METSENKASVKQMYNDELRCIQQLLSHSEMLINNKELHTVKDVSSLLKERELWISVLKKIEIELKSFNIEDDEIMLIKHEISELGNSLIAIDARLMDILSNRKKTLIKEMENLAENRSRRRKVNGNIPRVIDIKQE